MSPPQAGTILGNFRALFTREAPSGQADQDLLARYRADRDESAFATLLQRHGPLVWGVCWRVLRHRQDAEDAFQAAFLVLARRAGAIRQRESLSSWLYGVAYRTALNARRRLARRQLETPPAHREPEQPVSVAALHELQRLLDEEVARLPDKLRAPFVLCCLEGKSREEAARELGSNEGTLSGRIAEARLRLQRRLLSRGVSLTSALAALAVGPATALPAALARRTGTAAGQIAAGRALRAVASERVATLAEVGLRATALGRLKLLAPALLLVAVLGAGAGVLSGSKGAGQVQRAPAAGQRETDADDPLPPGSALRFGTSRFRQGTEIAVLTVSADGKLAFAGNGRHSLGSARLFDLTTGRVLYRLPGLGINVEAAGLSPDGRTLATKRYDGFVCLCDATSGKELSRIDIRCATARTITEWLIFSPDGARLAVSADGKAISIIDPARKAVVRTLGPQNTVFAAAFSPDGRTLAAGGYDSQKDGYFFRLWDVNTGREVRRFCGHHGGIRTIAFSPDGATLASGGDDGACRLWEVATGKEKRAFTVCKWRVRSVAFTPDGKTLAVAASALHLFDLATGKERLKIDQVARWLHVDTGGRMLTAAVAGAIHRWDLATGALRTPAGGDAAVEQVVLTPDGRRLVTREEGGGVHLWNARTGKHLARLETQAQGKVAASPRGRLLAWSVEDSTVKFKDPEHANWTHDGSRIRLYDLVAGRLLDRFPGCAGYTHELAFSPDGTRLVTVDHHVNHVRIWEVASGKLARSFPVVRKDDQKRTYAIHHTALSPDGRTLAVAYRRMDRTDLLLGSAAVRLWDVNTGKELHELTGHWNASAGLAFSPDGRLLVTCGDSANGWGQRGARSPMDATFVWEVATGTMVSGLPEGFRSGAGSVAFSPDGRTLATASEGIIRLWEVASWQVRAEFRGHRDRVTVLRFGPDGRLFSGSLDSTVLAWDTRPRAAGGSLPGAWNELAGEAKPAFAAQGRLLAGGARAVPLLARLLRPAQKVDPARVAALIDDLGSPDFSTRDAASRALDRLGRVAEPALRQASQKGDLEVRQRAGKLLNRLAKQRRTPDELRLLRAVEVLEWLATPPARALLADLATGEPGADLTRAARAALRRLGG
jgi:RNA polymerase sigma factor (sigma-70 family)